ncbi:hypothetical protein EMCRGX_G014704 [Ephydatia muelleri]
MSSDIETLLRNVTWNNTGLPLYSESKSDQIEMQQEGALTSFLRLEAFLAKATENLSPRWIFQFCGEPRCRADYMRNCAMILPKTHQYDTQGLIHYHAIFRGWLQLTSRDVHTSVQNTRTLSLDSAANSGFYVEALKQDCDCDKSAEVFVSGRAHLTGGLSVLTTMKDGTRTGERVEPSVSDLLQPSVQVPFNTSELTPLQIVKQDTHWYLHFEFEQTKIAQVSDFKYSEHDPPLPLELDGNGIDLLGLMAQMCQDKRSLPPSRRDSEVDAVELSIECTEDNKACSYTLQNDVLLQCCIRNGEFSYVEADDDSIVLTYQVSKTLKEFMSHQLKTSTYTLPNSGGFSGWIITCNERNKHKGIKEEIR